MTRAPDGDPRHERSAHQHAPTPDGGARGEHQSGGHAGHAGHKPDGPPAPHYDPVAHAAHAGHSTPAGHAQNGSHAGHGEEMFRRPFWVSLVLALPVLLYAEHIQMLLGYAAPAFPGSRWIEPVPASVIYWYGGWVFLTGA